MNIDDHIESLAAHHDQRLRLRREGAEEALKSSATAADLLFGSILRNGEDPSDITGCSEPLREHPELLTVQLPTDFCIASVVLAEMNHGIDLSPLKDFAVSTPKGVHRIRDHHGVCSAEFEPGPEPLAGRSEGRGEGGRNHGR